MCISGYPKSQLGFSLGFFSRRTHHYIHALHELKETSTSMSKLLQTILDHLWLGLHHWSFHSVLFLFFPDTQTTSHFQGARSGQDTWKPQGCSLSLEEPCPPDVCTQAGQQQLLQHPLPTADRNALIKHIFPWKIWIHPSFFHRLFGNIPLSTKPLPGKVSQAGIFSRCVEKPPGSCQQLADLRWPVSNKHPRSKLPTSLTPWLLSWALCLVPTISINQKR